MRDLFMSLRHSMIAEDTAHLTDGEIRLLLRNFSRGSSYVGKLPCYNFVIVDAKEPRIEMGRCDLRVGMDEAILYAGHIGYRVYPRYRGHHYAQKATRLLLHFAAELGFGEVIITCDPDNEASYRTLDGLGGELRDTVDVPEDSPCYKAGDRRKCQFYYKAADYFNPEWANPSVQRVLADEERLEIWAQKVRGENE